MRAAFVCCALASALTAATLEPPKLLLGTDVVPQRYRVDLTLVPNAETFHGAVEIDIRIGKPTPVIWLNGANLTISSARLRQNGANLTTTLTPELHGFIALQFDRPVSGEGTLRFVYDGKIARNSSAGIFALQEDNEWYVFSQFEPTDARRAFPCFDQPEFKTPWQITLHVQTASGAFANTPQMSETAEDGGMKAVHFAESKPLPSYLVAFAAGHFDTVDAGHVGKTPLRVIVPHGHASGATWAAGIIAPLLALEEKYFGIPFPYEKLDSIVMPVSNFAMENAGLITYGQDILLADPQADSVTRQRECAYVVAHEMAHQWFGDLVTTKWWDDVWLNEAFATWMERKATGEWKPDWRMDVAGVEDGLRSMQLDSLVSARRIVQPIESDNDIANAFDDITYRKGSAVLAMFEHYAGAEPFRRGVRAYLKRYMWGAATTPQFLAAVSAGAHVNMTGAFETFLNQAGIPMVTEAIDCSGPKPVLRLSQKRSLPVGAPPTGEQTWQIPVSVRYRDDGGLHEQRALLTSKQSEVPLPAARGCPAWLLGNSEAAGYYRVRYEGALLDRLFEGDEKDLSVSERVSELGNVNALVGTGDVPPAKVLALMPKSGADSSSEVVNMAIEAASRVREPFIPSGLDAQAAHYIRSAFGERAEFLGWRSQDGESDDVRLLRAKLTPFVAADGHDEKLIETAESLARQWLKERSGVAPEMVPMVLMVAAEFGDRSLWESMHQQALAEKDPGIRQHILRALGSFREPALAEASLRLLLTREFDPRTGFFSLLLGPTRFSETRDLPFQFVRANLDSLLAGLPREVGGDYASGLAFTGNTFCDAVHRDQMEEFFSVRVRDYVGGERILRNVLETIDLCIARKKAVEPGIAEVLSKY